MEDVRRQILETLDEYGKKWPDMRFGQLVIAVAESARGPRIEAVYDVEDTEFLQVCRRLLRDHAARTTAEPEGELKVPTAAAAT